MPRLRPHSVDIRGEHALTVHYQDQFARAYMGRRSAATRTRGTVAVVGGVEGFAAELEIMPLLAGAKRLMGIVVGSRTMFEDLNRFVAAARIRPVIDRVFEFENAREALGFLSSGGHFGKVVINVGSTR
jgi:NADPH:quinone reductase-like Zn-dependent oxidoreductase